MNLQTMLEYEGTSVVLNARTGCKDMRRSRMKLLYQTGCCSLLSVSVFRASAGEVSFFRFVSVGLCSSARKNESREDETERNIGAFSGGAIALSNRCLCSIQQQQQQSDDHHQHHHHNKLAPAPRGRSSASPMLHNHDQNCGPMHPRS